MPTYFTRLKCFTIILQRRDSKYSLIFLHCILATQTSVKETNPGPNQNIPVELVKRRLPGMTSASCVTHVVLDITVIAKAKGP